MSTMSGNRSALSSIVVVMVLVMTVLLAALMLLTQTGNSSVALTVSRAEAAVVPNWLDGRQATIEPGLIVSPHAAKHAAEALDARRIYDMLLQGKCAAAARFCDSNGKQLYLCFDPVTGLLGGLFVQDGIIDSGWGSRASYWAGKVRGTDAPFKADRCYQ